MIKIGQLTFCKYSNKFPVINIANPENNEYWTNWDLSKFNLFGSDEFLISS